VLYAHIEDAPKDAAKDVPPKPDANIYIFDTKTGTQHPIVTAPGYDGGPFFSPDGKSICYRSDRAGNDLLQLYVADLKFEKDASGTPIPVGVEREYQLTKNENVNWCPFWHPSGTYLIYGTSEVSHANYEVFAIEVDRGHLGKLAARAKAGETIDASSARHARITKVAGADVLPVFSPDGKYMMWTAQRGAMAAGETKPSSQLWIADVAGDPFSTPRTP
jgi:Tol biopolymer transport system component